MGNSFTEVFVAIFAGLLCSVCRADSGSDGLIKFWEQLRVPRTLHCKVRTTIDFKSIPPGIVEVQGIDEYWLDGDHYRMSTQTDSTVFNGMSHDVRWDGERFQDFNTAGSLLIISKHARQKTPYIDLPLPLIPFIFLNPSGKDEGVKITFDDLRGEGTRALLEAGRTAEAGGLLQFPGGRRGGEETTYLIELGDSPPGSPRRIILRSAAGVDLASTEIVYQPIPCAGGVVYLPREVKTSSRTTDNRLMLVATFTATVMEADVPIPAETFTIDYQTARRVIDIDIPAAQRYAAILGKLPGAQNAQKPTAIAQAAPPVVSPGIVVGVTASQWSVTTVILALAGLAATAAALVMIFYRAINNGGRQ